MINNLTQLIFEDIVTWLRSNPDVFIITDIKTDNIKGLKYMSGYQDIVKNIIPQIYSFEEYKEVKELGYENIILTLYFSDYSNSEIINFVKNNKIWAITMHYEQGLTELPQKLSDIKIYSFAHTVNDFVLAEKLIDNGINGLYTDFLEQIYFQ